MLIKNNDFTQIITIPWWPSCLTSSSTSLSTLTKAVSLNPHVAGALDSDLNWIRLSVLLPIKKLVVLLKFSGFFNKLKLAALNNWYSIILQVALSTNQSYLKGKWFKTWKQLNKTGFFLWELTWTNETNGRNCSVKLSFLIKPVCLLKNHPLVNNSYWTSLTSFKIKYVRNVLYMECSQNIWRNCGVICLSKLYSGS